MWPATSKALPCWYHIIYQADFFLLQHVSYKYKANTFVNFFLVWNPGARTKLILLPGKASANLTPPPPITNENLVATRSFSYRLILHNIRKICPPVTQKVACSGPGSCHLVPRQLQLILIWFACMCHPVPTGHPECWLASCGWSKPYTRHWDLTIMLWMANLTSRTWSNHTTTTHICPWSSATANLLATHYKGGQPTAQQNMTVCCLGSKMEEQALHWQNLRNYHLTVLHLHTQVKLQFTTMSWKSIFGGNGSSHFIDMFDSSE